MKPKWIGLALAIATALTVLVNQRDVGIARDETVYFAAGDHYADWWVRALTFRRHASIAQTFGGALGGAGNPEHPPLMKLASGLAHRWLPGDVTAYRVPAAALHGLCAYLIFAFALELWGLAEAVLAVLAFALLPRALFHAGLACFDAPAMALWFATIYAYWRCLDGRAWPWQVGVAWGLLLATKHTALLLPLALAAHQAILIWRAKRFTHWRIAVSMVVLGPLVLFVLWPWLWLAPIAHARDWLGFHLHHVHYNYEYLGTNWNAPPFPWHVALVTTLLTVPTATLAACALGSGVLASRWRARPRDARDARAPGWLLLVSALASIGPFFLGSTPIFGAEKHWMPILPSVCLAAGCGAAWAARRAGTVVKPRVALGIVGGALALAGISEVSVAEPYALTWYSALAGGAPGGADLGMNRQFWGVAARGVLPELAAQPPGPVYSHDASPAWGWYERFGLLPKGHPDAGHEGAGIAASKYAIVIHEKHFNRHDYMIWKSYGTVQPIYVLRTSGVPIVSVYKRP